MRTQREYLQTMDDDSKLLQSLLVHPLHEPTKIKVFIPERFPPFHLGKSSIYRLERHNNHEKMRGMVEDVAPYCLDQILK
jgi:hypothetical protein